MRIIIRFTKKHYLFRHVLSSTSNSGVTDWVNACRNVPRAARRSTRRTQSGWRRGRKCPVEIPCDRLRDLVNAPVTPARLPTELMIASPAAAAIPANIRPASIQNTGMMLMMPAAIIVIRPIDRPRFVLVVALAISAIPATAAGMAALGRRSSCRPAQRALNTMATAAAR